VSVALSPRTIATRDEITPEWLAAALGGENREAAPAVTSLVVERWRAKTLSDLYRLRVAYRDAEDLPATFILKLARIDADASLASRRRWKEHEFYTRVAAVMLDPPVPRLFAAAFDPASHRSYLLIEDLTDTHGAPQAPLPPTPEQLVGDVDCLARIHAVWWEHPELAAAVAERHPGWIAERSAGTRRRLRRFLDSFGEQIPRASREALDTACAGWETILRRSAAMPLTVVHGDAHPWNFLSPVDPNGNGTRLLDWEGWSIEPGPHDLASLIALHLPVDERRALEEELVARYVAGLAREGVTGYEPATVYDDYRLAVARRVLSPVGLWSRGTRARSWWPALEHITAAFHDLRCADLL
jgi:aminoglycoside phosphotransferase (APT) family kinase protein